MTLAASISHFIPDAKLMFRNNGQPALTESFKSQPIELARLFAQWHVNEYGRQDEMRVWVNVERAHFNSLEVVYCFALEVDVRPSFSDPAVVAIYDYHGQENPFEITLMKTVLEEIRPNATVMRLAMTPTPDAPSIQFAAFPRGDTPRA
jgi:hypothetical protein